MKKQPKLILREAAVLDMTRSFPPARFVEMGAGTGHMASLFLERGFHGICHDLGESSRRKIRQRFERCQEKIQVVDSLHELSPETFDYLLAFEVLEHIEDDQQVLKEWLQYLKPDGLFIASVPAHKRKFGKSDDMAGHVRRYEKNELFQLLEASGLQEIEIINYGFPITEATRVISNILISKDYSRDHLNQQEKSIVSAQSQSKIIRKTLNFSNDRLFRPFCVIQKFFYKFDLGDGMVVTARKK